MPILEHARTGQKVSVPDKETMNDFLKQGYRIPQGVLTPPVAPVPAKKPVVTDPEPLVEMTAVDLATAELPALVELPGVGTAKGRQIMELAKADNLSLTTLEEIGGVDWVELYQAGKVVWPGGLQVEETEEEQEEE